MDEGLGVRMELGRNRDGEKSNCEGKSELGGRSINGGMGKYRERRR